MNFDWRSLAPDLAGQLLAGSVGTGHLSAVGRRCLELAASDPGQAQVYGRLALDTVASAWAWSPLDHRAAEQVLSLLGTSQGQGQAHPLRTFADMVVQASRPSPEAQRAAGLVTRGRVDQAQELLASALGRDPLSAPLLRQVMDLGLRQDRLDWATALLSRPWPPAAEPLQAAILADLAFFRQDWEAAAHYYEQALDSRAFPALRPRLAECRLRQGQREAAILEYRAACQAQPWNTSALLRLADLAQEVDLETALLPGRVAVLLYSYNKATELAATLAALFTSDLPRAKVLVLDNGSTDGTGQVLDAWDERVNGRAEGQLIRVDLPVNIGAPAARNWLLARPEVQAADFVAYVDDDALPPADWLGKLGAAVQRFPQAGAWGCKVVDAALPRIIQSADLHLKPEDAQAAPSGHQTPAPLHNDPQRTPGQVRTTDMHLESLDFGQFDCLRPCVSVTGCLHLFRTEELTAAKGFDIRFSPSQYDDLDRDLASCLAGKPAVYSGHLAVPHLKRSGELAKVSPAATGNGLGNQHKLNHKYPQSALTRLREFDLANMIEDMEEKQEELRRLGL